MRDRARAGGDAGFSEARPTRPMNCRAVSRTHHGAGVEIVTRSRTNQIKVMMAPAAVATMPSTQADIARLRPPSAPADASMRLFADLPMKYAIGPQIKPGMPKGSPSTKPTIASTSATTARLSIVCAFPYTGGGYEGGGWYGTTGAGD